jgi:short-subunit dehydrogenase involved in D-alanine esterification of teichoic acids
VVIASRDATKLANALQTAPELTSFTLDVT